MKIRKIKHIDIGPFKNFRWSADIPDFDDKINIILGWNGTGKTIVSRIIRSFELEEIHTKIDGAEFSVEFNDKLRDNNDLAGLKNKIRVFNEDYMEKVLSQSYLDYVIAIGESEVDVSKKEKEKAEIQDEFDKIKCKNEYDEIAQDVALNVIKPIAGIGHIQKELEIGGSYNSYSKDSFKKRIKWITNEIKQEGKTVDGFIKTEEEITELREQLKNQGRKEEEYQKLKKWNDWILSIDDKRISQLQKINKVFSFVPQYKASERISKYPDWSPEGKWIREGIDLHKLKDSGRALDRCLFCDSPIQNKEELLKHFSDDLIKLTRSLDDIERKTKEALVDINSCKTFYKQEKERLKRFFTNLQEKIEIKKENKLQTVSDVENFENLFTEAENTKDLTNIARGIEIHYVAQKYKSYIKKKQAFEECQKNKQSLENKLNKISSELKRLKEKAKNVHIPEDNLNNLLKVVFPYKNIRMSDSEEGIGYILERNNRQCDLNDLSTGERNFLALAYFLLSLNTKEEGRQFSEDGIVVIDDPVSSLDSDSLFYVYSILLGEIEVNTNRQYFILTHNLDFFGHLLERFRELNKFYQITLNNSGASISKLQDNLSNYNSDYRYAISKLKEIKDSSDINDKIFAANLLRRVLETFLHFKYGQGDLRGKIEKVYVKYEKIILDLDSVSDQYKKERKKQIVGEKELLYRFINYGSHEFLGIDKIDLSVLNHSTDIINNFFKIVERIDKEHYKSFKFYDQNL